MVSDTELSEFFGPRRVPGRELSELLSAYSLCQSELTKLFAELSKQWDLSSKKVLSKQYSARFLKALSNPSKRLLNPSKGSV